VHGAVAGWLGRICVIQPGEGLLNLLYPDGGEAQGEEQQMGTLSFTAALTASWQAAETVKLLLGKPGLKGEILEVDLLQASVKRLRSHNSEIIDSTVLLSVYGDLPYFVWTYGIQT